MRHIKKFDINEGIFSYFSKEKKEERSKKNAIIDKVKTLANAYKLRIINYYDNERGNTRIGTDYGAMYININEDFTVDILGNVEMNDVDSLNFKFRNVSGNFKVKNSYNIDNFLYNFPDKIDGKLIITDCGLNSLKSLPTKYVGRDFKCASNNLQTFEGLPEYIGGDIDADSNDIYTYEFLQNFKGRISLYLNPIQYIQFSDRSSVKTFTDIFGRNATYADSNYDVFMACDPIHPPVNNRSKPILYVNRMNSFAEEIGLEFKVTRALQNQYDVR